MRGEYHRIVNSNIIAAGGDKSVVRRGSHRSWVHISDMWLTICKWLYGKAEAHGPQDGIEAAQFRIPVHRQCPIKLRGVELGRFRHGRDATIGLCHLPKRHQQFALVIIRQDCIECARSSRNRSAMASSCGRSFNFDHSLIRAALPITPATARALDVGVLGLKRIFCKPLRRTCSRPSSARNSRTGGYRLPSGILEQQSRALRSKSSSFRCRRRRRARAHIRAERWPNPAARCRSNRTA